MGFRFDIAKSDTCMSQYWQWVFNHSFGHHESSYRHDMKLFKRAMSTILSDFLNRNCSPNLEQMWVKIHLKRPKTQKSGFQEIFRGKHVCKQFVSGLLWFKSIKITPPLYDELRTRGIGVLMKMSSVKNFNHGRKPTLTENG